MRQFFYIILIITLFISCKGNEGYVIDGKITGLENPLLCFVVPDPDGNGLRVDTVIAESDGKFKYEGSSRELISLVLYMEEGSVWTTVWARNKDKLSLTGDVHYPEMIVTKGGEVNDLLTSFKLENKALLLEKRDLTDHYASNIEMSDSLDTKRNHPEYESKLLNIDHQLRGNAEKFINDNLSSVASLVLIQDYLMDGCDPELARNYLSKIEELATQDTLYKKLVKVNDKFRQTLPGSKAPDFMVLDINNDTVRLDSYRNKYFLLTFAASWCEPCDKDSEDLALLYKQSDRKRFEILTVSLDQDTSAWKKVVKEKKLAWSQVVDPGGWNSDIVSLYNITEIPSSILIDKESIIVGKNLPTDSIKNLLISN